jgi:hypothetical protein
MQLYRRACIGLDDTQDTLDRLEDACSILGFSETYTFHVWAGPEVPIGLEVASRPLNRCYAVGHNPSATPLPLRQLSPAADNE